MSAGFPWRIETLPPSLVLRVRGQDSSYSRKDYHCFGLHLVLRDVPGHSRQDRRSLRRGDRLAVLHLRDRDLPTSASIAGRVPGTPRAVRAAMPRALARGLAARPLSITYARIGINPASTYRTRPLLEHCDGTIARRGAEPGRSYPGSFLASRPGSFFASSEAEDRRRPRGEGAGGGMFVLRWTARCRRFPAQPAGRRR